MFAARIASVPNQACISAARISGVRSPKASCIACADSAKPMNSPFESKKERPSFSACSPCLRVAGTRRCSIVLNDVPASEPSRPLCENIDRAPTVSSIEMPNEFAPSADWERPRPRPSTSVADLLAPAASTSAANVASLPFNPNAFNWLEVISAATPKSNAPAPANPSAPGTAPPSTSPSPTPALISSI